MMKFTKKDLLAKDISLGEIFRQKREEQSLNLDKISKKLGIKINYLQALEKNEFDKLPGGLYVKKFSQEYGSYLEIDAEDILKKLEQTLPLNNNQAIDYFSHRKISKNNLLIFPRIIRNLLIVALAITCLLYLSIYFRNLVSSPNLEIIYPPQNLSTTEMSITVSGKTEKEAQITINSQPVLSDASGYFEKSINLKTGLNKIIFKVKKKYSQENIQNRQILVK